MAGIRPLRGHLGAGLLHRQSMVGQRLHHHALKALVEYWFKNTDSNWLACSHAVENPASGKVMMKAGFVYDHEAVYHKFDGTAIPCKCYALTREHYKEQPLRQR